jgi:hypothetical protein
MVIKKAEPTGFRSSSTVEDGANLSLQPLHGEGFLQKLLTCVQQAFLDEAGVRITRHIEDP